MFLKSAALKFFAKIIGENYVFCWSSHISFNPASHLKKKNILLFEEDPHRSEIRVGWAQIKSQMIFASF